MNEENIIGDVDIFAHQKPAESAAHEANSADDIGDIDIFAHQTEGRRIAARSLAEGDAYKAANLRDMSERFGENRTVAGLEIDFLNTQATTEDYLNQLGIVPGVARWMSENPKDAPIFKNDLPRLQNVQRVIPKGGIGSLVYAFSQGLSSGIADVDYGNHMYRLIENPELANDEAFKLNQDRLKKLSESYSEDNYDHRYVQTAGQFLGMMGGSVAKGADEAKLMGTLGLAYGLAGGPVTAGGLSAAMGVAGMTGGMYKTEAGMTMATLLELGVPIEKARTIAIGVGGINAAIELLGGAAAIKAASPAFKALSPSVQRFIQSKVLSSETGALEKLTLGNFAKKAVVGGVGSASSEAGTEMIQEGVNIAGEEIGKVWGETGKRAITPEEAWQRVSGVGEETFGGAGVLYMLGLGLLTPFRLARIHKAQQTKEFFDTLNTEVAQMEGAKLSPGATKEVVDAMTEDAGVGTVYIDGLSFSQSMRRVGVTIDEVREVAPDIADQIEQASVSGSDVTMTTGDFAAKFSQTPLGQELTNHVRLSESDISPAEGKSLEKQVQEMRQAMEAKGDQAETDAEDAKAAAVKAEIRSVRGQIFDALKAAGFSTEKSRAQAHFGENVLRAFAISAGLDAEGVRRFAPTVVNRVKSTKDITQAMKVGIGQYSLEVAKNKLEEESKAWGDAVDSMAAKPTQPVVMLKQTPLAMHLVGADFLTLRAHPHVFDGLFPNAKKSSKKHHSHPAMTRDVLKQIPSALADPVAIFKDDKKDGTYVFMLDVTDSNGDTMIVPVAFNASGRHAEINLVQTAFGRERKLWFPLQEQRGLLLYANSKKIQRWNKSSGTNRLRGSNADGSIVLNEDDLEKLRNEYPSYYQPLSSRYPTAARKTEDADTQMLYADYETAKTQPAFMKKNAALLKTIPGMASRKRNPESIAEDFIERAKQNLLFLFDLVPEEARNRAKLWYDGGRRMSQTWAQRYGIATQTAAAVIAVLSPQKGWFENVSMGERILDAVTTKRDFVWDEAMTKKANAIANDPKLSAKRARAEGKSLGELLSGGDYEAAAIWMRCYDQVYNDPGYRILSPEGGAQDYARTKSGKKASLRWQSYDVIAKAISCIEDPRLSNISLQLGGNHKVRNFYNNIAHPELAEFATIDTHAVAAVTLIPLAAKDVIVDQNFGGKGSASSAVTGLSGTYPFFLEAYKRAAAERGVLPREMQSITWEAIRAIYTDRFKTAANKQAIVDIWKSVDKGEITAADARKKVVELAGGLKKFAWEDKAYDEAVGDTYDRAGVDAQIEVGTGAVNFEVAPDPSNAELAARWSALPTEERARISAVVAKEVTDRVLAEFEAEGTLASQVSGQGGAVGTGFALFLEKGPQAMPIAKMLGYVLNLKSVLVVSDKAEVGTEKTGSVSITLPDGYSSSQIEDLYKKLWSLTGSEGERLCGQFFARGNTMTILNNTEWSDEWFSNKIKDVVADFSVATETVNAGSLSNDSGDYSYEGDSRANNLRDEATKILYRELDLAAKQGISGNSAKSSGADNSGNLGEQQGNLAGGAGQDSQGAPAMAGSGAGAQGRRDQGSERGIQGSAPGAASDAVARREPPERLANRELVGSGIGGPRRRWENTDAEAHRIVAQRLRADFERNGARDYRVDYGRQMGPSVASRTARAVGASYRRRHRVGQDVRWAVTWEPDDKLADIYAKNGLSAPAFHEHDGGEEAAKVFQASITASKVGKYSAAVYVYPVEEYAQMRLFLTEDKTAGFAIKKNGDVVSVFKTPDSTHDSVVYSILATASVAGGDHMDCFDTVLPMLYSAWGYRVVARQKWNDEYAPEGWEKENFKKYNNGEPDVCYLALDPGYYGAYQGYEGVTVDDYDEVVALQKEAYTELAKAAQRKSDTDVFAQAAYHGSPYRFDKFTLDIGSGDGDIRGSFNPATNRISLTPDADLSTFAHEMSHWYLENIFVAVKLPTATESLKRDVAAMLKDFGLNSVDDWEALDFDAKSKLHERFAYQFERYLAEGKAPSKETEGFFRRIGKFIRDVYRAWTGGAPEALDDTYKRLFGENLPELSDEVRRVMDRMVESEDRVNAAVQAESLLPLFAQKPEGMSDEDWADYQASIDDSTSEAVEALTKMRSSDERWHIRARSKALKEIQKKGKEVRDKIRERVARHVNNRPEALAIDILKSGGKAMGVANLKIDPATLTWLNAAQIESLRSMGVLKKGGVHVRTARSMLSPMARFSSDKQMIDRILSFRDRDSVIEEQTTQEAMRTHGELFDPKKIDEAVTAAVHNEARERMLGHELKALLGEGRSRVYIAAAKKAADELLARTPLRLATVRHFLTAESRAAKRAEEAMKKGNIQEAAMYKRQQLVQHNAARAVVGAQEMTRRMKKNEALIFRKDAKLAKNYDTNILAVARAILANNGFGPTNAQPAEAYLEKVRKYDPDVVFGLQAFIDRNPYRSDTREMTVAELLRIYEDVDNLVALARTAKRVTLDGKSRDLDEVVDEMIVQIATLGKTPYRPGSKRAATRREALRKLYMSGRAMLTRVETWCIEMDGGNADGVFTRNIFRPIAKAAATYRNANIAYQKRLKDMLDPMWQKLDSQGEIEAPELGYVFERKAELIGALLHIGNESNKEKLLIGGRGEGASWADVRELEDGTQNVSYARWDAFLARCFQEGIVTKEDMDFVQSVWDLLEETKEMSQRAFRDYYGFYFEEVEASPVVTPFGVYRGGYVPAATDPVLTAGRDKQLERDLFESESEFFDMMPVRQPGWSKSRVIKYNKPLQLNVGMIGSHLNSVVKFAYMANPVKNVQRVINSRKLKDAIDNYDPQVMPDMLSPWLRRSATQTVGEPSNGFGRILNKLRSLSGMSLMAANLSNALQQYTGLSIAANLIGAKQASIGLGQYIASPKQARERVSVASEFMRARLNDMAFEFQSQIERMASDRVPTTAEKVRDWTTRHAYFLQTFAQRTVDIPVWLGAYDKAVKDGMSDEDAVQYADSVVRRTQGSFDPESVAKVETGSPVFRSLLVFYNYFNMQLNLVHQRYAERMANKEYGRFAMDVFAIVALPAVMSEAIAQAFGGFDAGDDDDWDAFDALSLVISSINKNLVAMIPFIGNWINVGGTKIAKSGDNAVSDVAKLLFGSNTYNDRLLSVPVASLIENSWQAVPSTIRALEGDGSARAAARNSLDAVTLITGIPVSGLKKPVGYAAGVAAGEIDPESPADVVRGLVSGKDVNK